MNDGRDREEWRRERSLLALGRAMRGVDDAAPSRSLLSAADDGGDHMDAQTRHGLARRRREAQLEEAAFDAEPEPWPAPAEDDDQAWETGFVDSDAGRAMVYGAPPPPRQGQGRGYATVGVEENSIGYYPDEVGEEAAPPSGRGAAPRRRPSWRLAAATTVLGACLGAAVAVSLPARYAATAELALGGEGAGQPAGSAVDSQLRVLTSGMVLNRVVDRLNLADDPEFNGRDGGAGLGGLLRAILMRGDAAVDDGHRQAVAVDRLAGTLSVAPGGGFVSVVATTGNGEKSALIANAVADAFVEIHEQNRFGAATGDNGAADAGNGAGDAAFATAQRRLAGFAAAHGLGDAAREPDKVAQILKLDADLAAARTHTQSLNAKVASLRSAGVDSAAAGLPREFETGAIGTLRAQYLSLKQQADSAAVKLGPRNPELRSIEAQLAGARDRLSDELRRIVANQQAGLKQAVETEQGYAARLARTGLSGEDIAALRDLQQAVAAAQVDRQTITASVPAGDAGAAGQGPHVVARAEAPLQPSGPSRTLLTLAGSVLGLFAGLGIGMLRDGAGAAAEADLETGIEAGEEFPLDDETRSAGFDDRRAGSGDWRRPGRPPTGLSAPWPVGRPAAPPACPSGSPDSAVTPDSTETVMYPAYPDPSYPPARQLQSPPQGQPQWFQPAEYPAYPPQPFAPPAPQYYPPSWPPQQAYPQAWQPAPPMPSYPYPQPVAAPMPPYAGQFYPPQAPYPYPPQDTGPAFDRGALDEIRASLHEFREALRELTETRGRRRIL